MLFALLRLDIKEAFRYNPLIFTLLPFIVGSYVYYMYLYIFGKKDNFFTKFPIYTWIIFIIIVIVYTIFRNLPMFPYLRP